MLQLSALLIAGAVLALVLKGQAPAISLVLTLGAGVLVFLRLMPYLEDIVDLIREIGELTGEGEYIYLLLRMVGVAYIAQFTGDICLDGGQRALGTKAVMAGRVIIACLGIPIVRALVEGINGVFG